MPWPTGTAVQAGWIVSELVPPDVLYNCTGIQKQSFNTVNQLMALLTENPDQLAIAEDTEAALSALKNVPISPTAGRTTTCAASTLIPVSR